MKTTRYAWLLENGKPQGHGLQYMTYNSGTGLFDWTEDVHAALHLSRRRDAELLAREWGEVWRIVEHGFCD